MSWEGARILAVVPARGGSKGILRKNLRKVGGISLVAHAGRLCAQLDWIDAAVLSTDDAEIADEGRAHGLAVPFLRPAYLGRDDATSVDMWRHAWLACEEVCSCTFDVSILLEPTSPLRTADDVQRTVIAVVEEGAQAAATVSRTPAHYSPQKTLTVDEQGEIGFFLEGGAGFSLRQKIPQYYHRNGLCYCVRRAQLVERGRIIEERCRDIVVDRPVVNIDEFFDLELADWLYARGC